MGLLVAVIAILGAFYPASSVPTITIPQGTYRGRTIQRADFPKPVDAFLGIRYAQPVIGDLRFARPVAVPPSNATYDASEFGAR